MKSNLLHSSQLLWLACVLFVSLRLLHAQTTGLSGMVKGTQGQAITGAHVTLQCGELGPGATVLKSESNSDGQYVFPAVPALVCRLQAMQSGFTATREIDLTHAQATQMQADLVLTSPLAGNTKPGSAPPTFEASGIRGLIDPGGYSVPANAAAATSLLSGMADVRRAGSASDAIPSVQPCTAAPVLLQAVRDQPASPRANRALGEFYLAHGESKLALPYLTAAHQGAPGDTVIATDLARADIAQEQFVLARALMAELPAAAQSSGTHVMLAQATEGLGMFAEAAAQYGLAQQQDRSIENIFGQGYELILAARLPAAEDVFRQGLVTFPQSTRLLIGRGIAEYLEGRSAQSVATFLQAVAADAGDALAHPFLAQAYLVSGEHADQVRAVMRNHLARSPRDGAAYYLLALVLSRSTSAGAPADDAEVKVLLEKSVALDPGLALAHFRLGVVMARQNENEAAAVEFEQALRLQPTLAEAHFRLSGVDRRLGRNEAAAEQMAIFRHTQPAGDSSDDEAGGDLRQFVSVMHRNDSKSKSAAEVCR